MVTDFSRGAALDVDGARQQSGAAKHAAHLFQMAAELHHHRCIGIRKAAFKLRLRQSRRQDHEHVVALRNRLAGQRPAAGHGGDARHDLRPVAGREAYMQMHIGAIEQRIALAEDRDGAAGIEMARDGGSRGIIEVADGFAVGDRACRHPDRHRIQHRQLLNAGTQMLRDGPARVAGVARFGEMRDDIRFGKCSCGLQGQKLRIARANSNADKTPTHKPVLASALTAAAVMALPPMRPRTMR